MSRMKIKDFKKLEFYQMPKWLFKVSGLKPVDFVIYTLAFNNWKLSVKNNLINENDEIYFFMTHEGIRDEIEIGKDQVIDSIKRLVESGVIIQEKFQGKATRFYLEDNLEEIKFKNNKNDKSSRKISTTGNPTTPVGKSYYTSTENPTTYQSENTDINKTNLLNKTIKKNNNNKISESKQLKNEIDELKITSELKLKLLEFIDFRKELKKPIKTFKSIDIMLKKIGTDFKTENELIKAIDKSIMNGYQGVFPINGTDIKKQEEPRRRWRSL